MFELILTLLALYLLYLLLKKDPHTKDKIITAALFVPLTIVAAAKSLFDKLKGN